VMWLARAGRMIVGAWCVVSVGSRIATAQGGGDARLARLDSATRVAFAVVVDSARRSRLPMEPLVDKALEGAKKGAEDDRIVAAVR